MKSTLKRLLAGVITASVLLSFGAVVSAEENDNIGNYDELVEGEPSFPEENDGISLSSGSPYTIADGFIYGIKEKTSPSDVISMFESAGVSWKGLSGETYVSTGSRFVLIKDEKEIDAVKVIVIGDVDGNGMISGTDYLKIKRFMLRTATLIDEYYTAADVDGDGSITTTDYLIIKKYFLGLAEI